MVATIYIEALMRARSRQMDLNDLLKSAELLKGGNPESPYAMVIELYKSWIAHNGDHPLSHFVYFNYAVSMSESGDLTGAVNALREAIRMKPDFFPPYINLGNLLERLGQADKAVGTWNALIDHCAAVTPDTVHYKLTAIKQVGRVLETNASDDAAENILWHSLNINAEQPDVVQHYVSLRQRQCKWPVMQTSERVSKKTLNGAISPLSVACYTDDPMFHLVTSYMYNRKSIGYPTFKPDGPKWERAKTINKGKLKIGYVSSDFRHHAVGFGMTDVLECHDRKKFEIHAYYCGIKTTDVTMERIKKSVDHWTDIMDMDDETAARKIREDKIDILIDLNGYTKDARTKIFAMLPAPINVNWFGFPNSMGSPYHHYIIADDVIIPPSHEIFYSEKVLRLPCYQANDRRRLIAESPSRTDVGLPEDAMVFCCLNGMQKITEPVFKRWMTIMNEVPDSVLWLLAGTDDSNERLRQLATSMGVDGSRLVFAGKLGNPEHLARYPLADLFLDSFPYGSHTTAADSMWMGVPIVTIAGRSFASRVCASLVRAAGLPELVADSPEAYVKIAISLGKKKAKLKELRKHLLDGRNKHVLFDMTLLTRHLEGLYVQMTEEFKRGELPVPDLRNLDIYHEIGITEDLEMSEFMTNEQYIARYRERLQQIHDLYPIQEDNRLWNHNNITLETMPDERSDAA